MIKYPKKSDLLKLCGQLVSIELKSGKFFLGVLEYADGINPVESWEFRKGFFHCCDYIFRVSHVKKVSIVKMSVEI